MAKPQPNPAPPVGTLLRTQRVEVLGRGLREMAALLDISAPHLTDIETGYRSPSEELLFRIAKLYKMEEATLRAGWSKPERIVEEVASQDSVTAAKVPEFLRTARHLSPQHWDRLIKQAKHLDEAGRQSGRSKRSRRDGGGA